MDSDITKRFISVEELARQDNDYRLLLEEYRLRNTQLLSQLETMNDRQRDAVLDYLGLAGEMHRKMLEFACRL